MCDTTPLAISGWETVVLAVLAILVAVIYGELRAHDAARRRQRHSRHPSSRPHEDKENEDTVTITDPTAPTWR